MQQRKSNIPFENRLIMKLSAWQHREDVRHNQTPFMFSTGRRRASSYSSEKSKMFAQKWLGA